MKNDGVNGGCRNLFLNFEEQFGNTYSNSIKINVLLYRNSTFKNLSKKNHSRHVKMLSYTHLHPHC